MSKDGFTRIREVLLRLDRDELGLMDALIEIDDLVAEETGEDYVLPDDFNEGGMQEELEEDEDEN